mgnify:FL=1
MDPLPDTGAPWSHTVPETCCSNHDKKCYATKHKLRSVFEKGFLVKFCEPSYPDFKGKVGVLLSLKRKDRSASLGSWWEVLVEGELCNFYTMYMRNAQ